MNFARFFSKFLFLTIMFYTFSGSLYGYVYTVINGTAYTIRIKIRGQASVYNLDDMIGDTQSNILYPGESRSFFIGYRIHTDAHQKWQGKDWLDGWNVGVCIANIFVEFLQFNGHFEAKHPLSGVYNDPIITIKAIATDRYAEFSAALQELSNSIGHAEERKEEDQGNTDAVKIVHGITQAGVEVTEGLAEPEVAAIKEATDAQKKLALAAVRELTTIYSTSFCRARDFFLAEIPTLNEKGVVTVHQKKYKIKYQDGTTKIIVRSIPSTQFVFITKDD